MGKKYIIGVDGGSQSTKVVIFDLEGNIVCQGRRNLKPMHLPAPGVVEHPGDDLWDSLKAAGRQAMQRFPGNRGDIVGLGLCTIRCCRALLKEDGTLAAPVISWMDLRLSRPYEHKDPQVRYVTATTGYITHRLTGEFNDTAANYEGQWPIDKDTWRWSEDPKMLERYNLPREMLFNLLPPAAIAGYVTKEAAAATGFPAGIPVVTTANDKAVEALGAGLLPGPSALISLGTYITAMVQGQENIKEAAHFFTNLAAVPYQYLYESGGIRRGMWTISWIKELLGDEVALKADARGITPENYLNEIASKVPAGSEGLMTVLEWLAPPEKPYKKGLMIGFDARHGAAHIFRSILEGIALTMKNHLDALCRELNLDLERIIISGGGSSGDLFMQIFADVFGLPAFRNVVNDSAGLGSALCAALALGLYGDYREAVAGMVRVRDVFEPCEAHHQLYRQMNEQVYRHITGYTDAILKRSHSLFG